MKPDIFFCQDGAWLDGQDFSYTLIRKNVKNINLRVKPCGSIVVSAHPRVPKSYIDDFVRSHIPFIQKARGRQQGKNPALPQQFVSGEQIPFLGKSLILEVAQADLKLVPTWIAQSQDGGITNLSRNRKGEAVFCQDGRLFMYAANLGHAASMQQLYESWQGIQAGIVCRQESRKYYPLFEELGVSYPEIKIRKMSSRWGSCIPSKHKITFNSLLLEKPVESIDYVIVHEFAHFIHPNHSKEFYAFVEQILPDWRLRKEKLS